MKILPARKPVVVYNFTIQDDHTYFVGSANGGEWVHNVDCPGDGTATGEDGDVLNHYSPNANLNETGISNPEGGANHLTDYDASLDEPGNVQNSLQNLGVNQPQGAPIYQYPVNVEGMNMTEFGTSVNGASDYGAGSIPANLVGAPTQVP